MGNAANRLLNIMKKTSENMNTKPSELISLTVKSIEPLIFSRDDRLEITEEFCTFSKSVSPSNLKIGDIVTAMVFNEGQSYFIQQNESQSGGDTGDYNDLNNKPSINGIELIGNKTDEQLNIGGKIDGIKVNGIIQTIVNKIVDIFVPTKTSDLTNDSGFINKDVNNLTNYELKTNTGTNINLSINSSTYVMTLQLKNSDGTVLSTGTVDLPLETMVVGASYDSTTKEIVLTLQNGTTLRFSVADLVSGLQTEITSTNKLASDLVDDTSQTNKFMTQSEKTKLANLKNEIYIGDEQDAPEDTELLIDSDEVANMGSEVVDSLDGNEINKAPSVRAVNEKLDNYIEIQTLTVTTTSSGTAWLCNLNKQVLAVWFASDDNHNGYIIPYRFTTNGWYGKFKTFSDANIVSESCKIQIALLNKST